MGKGEIAPSNFSFSHNVFYLFGGLSAIFIKFEMLSAKSSKLLKFVIWEGVNPFEDKLQ